MLMLRVNGEDDAASASARLKHELPGTGKEMKTSAEETLAKIGSTVDRTVQEGMHLKSTFFLEKHFHYVAMTFQS